jgi:glycosyltransferase involved in cell wall biosynthesis
MKPRLLLLGPHLGGHPGWVVSQGEILAGLFRREGYDVAMSSSVKQPLLRAIDLADAVLREGGRRDVAILSVFSGRAFAYAGLIGRLCQLGLPLVMVLHGGALPEQFATSPKRSRRVLARAARVVAPSGYLAAATRELGLEATVIPNVLDLDHYAYEEEPAPVDGPPRLLWLRTLHPVYHPELAIEVLARLHARGLQARLTLAGQDKGLLAPCRALAARLGLADALDFPGFLDMPAKQAAFANHDLFLNTNRIDNTPVTVLEAAAAGLPIVATNVGGVPHLLKDHESALLTPSEDPDAMAAAVLALWQDRDLRQRLRRQARQVAEASAWPAVHEQWVRLFADLTSAS